MRVATAVSTIIFFAVLGVTSPDGARANDARERDLREITSCLAGKKDPGSILIRASIAGDLEGVKGALARGARVVHRDGCADYRRTALLWASWNGREPVVRFLIGKGSDVNARDSDSMTSLMWAARFGHADVIALLLAAKARDTDRDRGLGYTPLMWAAWKGNDESVRLLLGAGGGRRPPWTGPSGSPLRAERRAPYRSSSPRGAT